MVAIPSVNDQRDHGTRSLSSLVYTAWNALSRRAGRGSSSSSNNSNSNNNSNNNNRSSGSDSNELPDGWSAPSGAPSPEDDTDSMTTAETAQPSSSSSTFASTPAASTAAAPAATAGTATATATALISSTAEANKINMAANAGSITTTAATATASLVDSVSGTWVSAYVAVDGQTVSAYLNSDDRIVSAAYTGSDGLLTIVSYTPKTTTVAAADSAVTTVTALVTASGSADNAPPTTTTGAGTASTHSDNSSTSTTKSSGNHTAMIVGLVVGVVVIAAIVLLLFFFRRSRVVRSIISREREVPRGAKALDSVDSLLAPGTKGAAASEKRRSVWSRKVDKNKPLPPDGISEIIILPPNVRASAIKRSGSGTLDSPTLSTPPASQCSYSTFPSTRNNNNNNYNNGSTKSPLVSRLKPAPLPLSARRPGSTAQTLRIHYRPSPTTEKPPHRWDARESIEESMQRGPHAPGMTERPHTMLSPLATVALAASSAAAAVGAVAAAAAAPRHAAAAVTGAQRQQQPQPEKAQKPQKSSQKSDKPQKPQKAQKHAQSRSRSEPQYDDEKLQQPPLSRSGTVSTRRSSRGSIGGWSIASSAFMSPSTLPWPMPPQTPTVSVAATSDDGRAGSSVAAASAAGLAPTEGTTAGGLSVRHLNVARSIRSARTASTRSSLILEPLPGESMWPTPTRVSLHAPSSRSLLRNQGQSQNGGGAGARRPSSRGSSSQLAYTSSAVPPPLPAGAVSASLGGIIVPPAATVTTHHNGQPTTVRIPISRYYPTTRPPA